MSTDNHRKAREFWLENSPFGEGASTYAVPFNKKEWLKTIYRDDAIHVREVLRDSDRVEQLEKMLKIAEDSISVAINGIFRGFFTEAENDLRKARSEIQSIRSRSESNEAEEKEDMTCKNFLKGKQ